MGLIKNDLIDFFNGIGLTDGCKGPIAQVISEVQVEEIGDMMVEFFKKD